MWKLAVALVEPVYPINLGYVARLMKNFGVEELILIEPKVCISEARAYASHGVDVLEKARISNLNKLREEFSLLVGTTAIAGRRSSNIRRMVISPVELAEKLKTGAGNVCIVLGRDTTGLTNRELNLCDVVISVQTGTDYTTLNVSHSLAIILYELSKLKKLKARRVASRQLRDRAVEYCLQLAEKSGLALHKRCLLQDALRRLLGRSSPTSKEIYLLMSLVRKAVLAIERSSKRGC